MTRTGLPQTDVGLRALRLEVDPTIVDDLTDRILLDLGRPLHEQRCGMLHCHGAAPDDEPHRFDLIGEAKSGGEVVATGDVTVPVCDPHRITVEIMVDVLPSDLLVEYLARLIDLDRHPLAWETTDEEGDDDG